jgi:flagellin-specific chaperone FliS
MFAHINNQLQYFYEQVKSKKKSKQEILTIMNRKKAALSGREFIKEEHVQEINKKFDEMISIVNRLPD